MTISSEDAETGSFCCGFWSTYASASAILSKLHRHGTQTDQRQPVICSAHLPEYTTHCLPVWSADCSKLPPTHNTVPSATWSACRSLLKTRRYRTSCDPSSTAHGESILRNIVIIRPSYKPLYAFVCPSVYRIRARNSKKIVEKIKNWCKSSSLHSTSKWSANFQSKRSKVKVTGRQIPQEIAAYLEYMFTYGRPAIKRGRLRRKDCKRGLNPLLGLICCQGLRHPATRWTALYYVGTRRRHLPYLFYTYVTIHSLFFELARFCYKFFFKISARFLAAKTVPSPRDAQCG